MKLLLQITDGVRSCTVGFAFTLLAAILTGCGSVRPTDVDLLVGGSAAAQNSHLTATAQVTTATVFPVAPGPAPMASPPPPSSVARPASALLAIDKTTSKSAVRPEPNARETKPSRPSILQTVQNNRSPVAAGGYSEGHDSQTVAAGSFFDATAAYQIPSTMINGHASPVDLWIEMGKSDKLIDHLNEYLKKYVALLAGGAQSTMLGHADAAPATVVSSEPIRIAKFVSAELIAASNDDFLIDKTGPQKFTARYDQPLMWHWEVTPKKPSAAGLILTLRVIADPGDGESPSIPILKMVTVKSDATPWEWIRQFVESSDALVTSIASLLGGIVAVGAALAGVCRLFGANGRLCRKLSSRTLKAEALSPTVDP